MPLRILGPEKLWGAELRVYGPTALSMEDLLARAGKENNVRLPGYIIDDIVDPVTCHISRLPRRVNLEVPPERYFERAVHAAQQTIRRFDFECSLEIEHQSEGEELRVILGLEEAYLAHR